VDPLLEACPVEVYTWRPSDIPHIVAVLTRRPSSLANL
jgi:hypothetical protein